MKEIVFICVNYNNFKDTIKYIEHLNKKLPLDSFDIVVIDNSENVNEYKELNNYLKNNKLENSYVVKSNENLGYFTGMQLGIDFYKRIKGNLPNFIVIGNTDIEIEDDNFLDCIKNNIKNNILALAPNIKLSNVEVLQNPFKVNKVKMQKLKLLSFIYKTSIMTFLYNLAFETFKKNKKSNKSNKSKIIYAPHGSYIILSKEFFDRGGSIKYDGFLYGEEIFLAEQILRLNGMVKFCDDIHILHNENSVTKFLENKTRRLYKLNSTNFLIKYIKDN